MVETWQTYDVGQTIESWIFIITGMLSIAFALFFLFIIRYSYMKGCGLIFLTIGILQITAGIFTHYAHLQSDSVQEKLSAESMAELTAKIQQTEFFLYTSMACIIAGIALYISFLRSPKTFWKGVGFGLLLEGLILSGLFAIKISGFKNYQSMVTQSVIDIH